MPSTPDTPKMLMLPGNEQLLQQYAVLLQQEQQQQQQYRQHHHYNNTSSSPQFSELDGIVPYQSSVFPDAPPMPPSSSYSSSNAAAAAAAVGTGARSSTPPTRGGGGGSSRPPAFSSMSPSSSAILSARKPRRTMSLPSALSPEGFQSSYDSSTVPKPTTPVSSKEKRLRSRLDELVQNQSRLRYYQMYMRMMSFELESLQAKRLG